MKPDELLNARPLPKRVIAKSGHSVPFFNTGFHTWAIVDAEDLGRTVCQISFHAADHNHPDYLAYMDARRQEAQQLAEIVNRGLETVA